jgi:hypothetical protein
MKYPRRAGRSGAQKTRARGRLYAKNLKEKSGRRETYHRGLLRERPSRLGLVAVAASHICSVFYSVNVSADTHDPRTGCSPNDDMSMHDQLPILICTALSRLATGREGGHPTPRFAGCVQRRRCLPSPSPADVEARLRPTSIYGFLPPYRYLLRSALALCDGEGRCTLRRTSATSRGRLEAGCMCKRAMQDGVSAVEKVIDV